MQIQENSGASETSWGNAKYGWATRSAARSIGLRIDERKKGGEFSLALEDSRASMILAGDSRAARGARERKRRGEQRSCWRQDVGRRGCEGRRKEEQRRQKLEATMVVCLLAPSSLSDTPSNMRICKNLPSTQRSSICHDSVIRTSETSLFALGESVVCRRGNTDYKCVYMLLSDIANGR